MPRSPAGEYTGAAVLPDRGVQRGRLLVGFAWMPEDGGRWPGMIPRQRSRPWRGYVRWKQPAGRHAAPRQPRQVRADTAVVRARLDDILGSPDDDATLPSLDVGS
jgi:hypothetical protein